MVFTPPFKSFVHSASIRWPHVFLFSSRLGIGKHFDLLDWNQGACITAIVLCNHYSYRIDSDNFTEAEDAPRTWNGQLSTSNLIHVMLFCVELCNIWGEGQWRKTTMDMGAVTICMRKVVLIANWQLCRISDIYTHATIAFIFPWFSLEEIGNWKHPPVNFVLTADM